MPRELNTGRRRRRTANGDLLTHDRIVDAALNLVERRGAAELSARSLGRALGADPSAVYRYFAAMDDVALALGNRLIRIALDSWRPAGDWRTSLFDLAQAFYHVYVHEYPQTGRMISHRVTRAPDEFRAAETVLGLLREAGFGDTAAARALVVLTDFVLGYSALDAGFATLPPQQQEADDNSWATAYSALPAHDYPNIAATAPALATVMKESSFELALSLLLDGLATSAPDCHPQG